MPKDDRVFWKRFGIGSVILAAACLACGIFFDGAGYVSSLVWAVLAGGSFFICKQKPSALELAFAPIPISKQPCPLNACPFVGPIDLGERIGCDYECPPMA